MKILLVDDHEETVQKLILLIGRKIKGEVRGAYKGDEAVRVAEDFKPDVIVLDIELPVLNGFDVLEELKNREVDTRVIMLSGAYTETEHIVRCIRAGACDFIKKPANVDKIVESIERHYLLENADNLRLYSQAPGLIKQLIDRADEEERKAKNAEVEGLIARTQRAEKELRDLNEKLIVRAQKAEDELHDLKLTNIQAESTRQQESIKTATMQNEPAPGKWRAWWTVISPNERAAYILFVGGCLTGVINFGVSNYNKLSVETNPKRIVAAVSSPKAGASPTNDTVISTSPKALGFTLEEYIDKLDSFGDRLGLKQDFMSGVEGNQVRWKGIIESANIVKAEYAHIGIRSEKNPYKYGVVYAYFNHPGQAIIDRVHTLQIGDLVEISGQLDTQKGNGVNATNLTVIGPANGRPPISTP